jgi:hypothetical protein
LLLVIATMLKLHFAFNGLEGAIAKLAATMEELRLTTERLP